VANRRSFIVGLAAAGVVGGCGVGATPTPTPAWPLVLPTATAAPVPGKLLLVHGGNFFAYDLASGKEVPLTSFPQSAFAASPALSPDRQRLAYSYYVVPSDPNDPGGSDLFVVDVDGRNPRLVRAHPAPGASYAEPTWTPDGAAVEVTYRRPIPSGSGAAASQPVSIVRLDLQGGAPTTLVDRGQTPAASPDGKHLAWLVADSTGQAKGLWVGDAAGQVARDVLSGRGFDLVRAPSFSPDGTLLAFAAVGGPRVTPTPARAAAFPGVAIAEAHGIPWDVWTIRPDGSDLRQLTFIGEDGPVPVWSPDGAWIAIAGEIGVYVVDAEGRKTTRLSTIVSGGGIAWLREGA
jgi:TolB protein